MLLLLMMVNCIIICFTIIIVYITSANQLGAWLGDPKASVGSDKLLTPNFTQQQVRSVDTRARDSTKLALGLLDIFFTKDKLSRSLCTKWDGREQLDPDIIEGIRCKYIL